MVGYTQGVYGVYIPGWVYPGCERRDTSLRNTAAPRRPTRFTVGQYLGGASHSPVSLLVDAPASPAPVSLLG